MLTYTVQTAQLFSEQSSAHRLNSPPQADGAVSSYRSQRDFVAGWGSGASDLQASVQALLRGKDTWSVD